jgi:hypothetical protein
MLFHPLPWERAYRTVAQHMDYPVSIHCLGNVFTEPLPSNGLSLWLHCSSFQASCHNILNPFLWWTVLLFRVQEVVSSNLGLQTIYPDSRFRGLPQCL